MNGLAVRLPPMTPGSPAVLRGRVPQAGRALLPAWAHGSIGLIMESAAQPGRLLDDLEKALA